MRNASGKHKRYLKDLFQEPYSPELGIRKVCKKLVIKTEELYTTYPDSRSFGCLMRKQQARKKEDVSKSKYHFDNLTV